MPPEVDLMSDKSDRHPNYQLQDMEDALVGLPEHEAALQDVQVTQTLHQTLRWREECRKTVPGNSTIARQHKHTFRQRVFEPTDVTQMDWFNRTFFKISRDFVHCDVKGQD